MSKQPKRSVQERFPLRGRSGSLAALKDGTLLGYLRLPGKNRSLCTEEQAMRDAFLLSDVLSTIKVPFSLLKYPVPASSSRSLVQIDAALAREREKLYSARSEDAAQTCRLKMQVLEKRMRPAAKRESTSSDRLRWPTYMVLKFAPPTTVSEAERALENLVRIAADKLGKAPEVLDTAEFAQLCGLYFTPSSTAPPSFLYSSSVPLPEFD